ncbi:predicted protein [Naegleria gruberi]|uniref:Predicted protein n=1 Tax=Naegleria gruberi TaxID=5762 RepID=D2W6D5_NAEGR|nr:uncharacterized protein NAEGRDRAFT_76978 [Naegleria gruberi]EFC35367.1 predicted protein [Naegleria gruberi]|eukprot:XP_002668111.1 predicted protein [Naegleria gruberi strain NEG-M]
MFSSGEGVEQDIDRAMFWLKEACDQGDHSCTILFGIMHYFGLHDCELDLEKSRQFLGKLGTQFDDRFLSKVNSSCCCNECFVEDFGFNYECANLSCDFDLCQRCYENGAKCNKCGNSKFAKHHALQLFVPLLKQLNEKPKHTKLETLIKLLE